jgi:hypothetical protein
LQQFHFYHTDILEEAFVGLTPAAAGLQAMQIENDLLPCRLDATTALRAHRQGIEIGHLVAVMASIRT